MKIKLSLSLGFIIAALFLISQASGACPAAGCGAGEESWTESAQSFISSDIPLVGLAQNSGASAIGSSFKAGEPANKSSNSTYSNTVSDSSEDYAQPEFQKDLFPDSNLLKPMQGISEGEVLLDVSGHRSSGEARIKGAILLPWDRLTYENKTIRQPSELAFILGSLGISERDRLIVYSDTFRSGEATFVLWALSLLGHDRVKALDGGLENWIAASQPLQIEENNRSATIYTPNPQPELLSDYEYVNSGDAQMVDARTFQDFGKSKIPNAIFIDPHKLVEVGRVKSAGELNMTFATLNSSQPVVVYSNDLLNSSLAWYALQLMGFDSRIYSWQDWQINEAAGN